MRQLRSARLSLDCAAPLTTFPRTHVPSAVRSRMHLISRSVECNSANSCPSQGGAAGDCISRLLSSSPPNSTANPTASPHRPGHRPSPFPPRQSVASAELAWSVITLSPCHHCPQQKSTVVCGECLRELRRLLPRPIRAASWRRKANTMAVWLAKMVQKATAFVKGKASGTNGASNGSSTTSGGGGNNLLATGAALVTLFFILVCLLSPVRMAPCCVTFSVSHEQQAYESQVHASVSPLRAQLPPDSFLCQHFSMFGILLPAVSPSRLLSES